MQQTLRDKIEQILLQNFSEIGPLTIKDYEIIDRFKDGSFGLSFASYLIYLNGFNERGKSINNHFGLLYYDEGTIFGKSRKKSWKKPLNGQGKTQIN